MEIPVEQIQEEYEAIKKVEDAIYKAASKDMEKYPLIEKAWTPLYQRVQVLANTLLVLNSYIPKPTPANEVKQPTNV